MERSREHKQQKAGEARGACFLQGLSSSVKPQQVCMDGAKKEDLHRLKLVGNT